MSVPQNPSNSSKQKLTILDQLRNGNAKFELVSVPVSSISVPTVSLPHRFFARIGSPAESSLPEKKLERFSVLKVAGDGRCLFRALVKGMAYNKGTSLGPRQEREDADELRMAVKEVICDNEKERHQYEAALVSITVAESLKRYCQRIESPEFWGGESELLVLSKLCKQPIVVYIPEHEHRGGGWGTKFISIAEYGSEFSKGSITRNPKKEVKLLYSGRNHYDLLI